MEGSKHVGTGAVSVILASNALNRLDALRIGVSPVVRLWKLDLLLLVLLLLRHGSGALARADLIRVTHAREEVRFDLAVGLAREQLVLAMLELVVSSVVDHDLGVVQHHLVAHLWLWDENGVEDGQSTNECKSKGNLLVARQATSVRLLASFDHTYNDVMVRNDLTLSSFLLWSQVLALLRRDILVDAGESGRLALHVGTISHLKLVNR